MGWRDERDAFDIQLGRHDRRPRDNRPDQGGWGLTSFLISIFSGVGLAVVFVITVGMAVVEERELDEKDPRAILIGLGFLAGLVMSIIGLVFGFTSLTQSRHNVVFAVLGVIFNAIIVIGVIGLICLGALMPK